MTHSRRYVFLQPICGRGYSIPVGPSKAPFFDAQTIASIIQYDGESRAIITVTGMVTVIGIRACLTFYFLPYLSCRK